MKFSSKLAIFGIVAGLSAAQVVIADEAAPEVLILVEETVTEVPSEEITEEPTTDEEVIDEKVTDEKVTDEEEGTDEEITEREYQYN